MKKGKTPVLNAGEACEPIDRIEIVRKVRKDDGTEGEESDLAGLRERALIVVNMP